MKIFLYKSLLIFLLVLILFKLTIGKLITNYEKKFNKIILCSIHQLPVKQDRIDKLLNNMEDVEFHFALEGICGKGRNFLLECIKEAKIFMNAKTIDSTKTTWSGLYKMMQEKGTR